VIIWDKGFTRPVEAQTTEEEEDEDIVFSSSFVLDALEDIEEEGTIAPSSSSWVEPSAEEITQDMADEIKRMCSGPMFPEDESKKTTSKGFGK